MTKALLEVQYLPPLEFFCALLSFDEILLEKHEHFVKQTYRNRCRINTAQGVLTLTVPLVHGNKATIAETQIDYTQKWQNQHWRSIESAYRNAPFFEFYSEELKVILYRVHASLFELNRELLSFCLRSIDLEILISETVTYQKEPPQNVFDLRSSIHPKKQHSGQPFYQAIPYYQVFGAAFAENLSLIDLLFCMGPKSREILRASVQNQVNK